MWRDAAYLWPDREKVLVLPASADLETIDHLALAWGFGHVRTRKPRPHPTDVAPGGLCADERLYVLGYASDGEELLLDPYRSLVLDALTREATTSWGWVVAWFEPVDRISRRVAMTAEEFMNAAPDDIDEYDVAYVVTIA